MQTNISLEGKLVAYTSEGKYVDEKITPGTTYNYLIKTLDTEGNESAGLPIKIRPLGFKDIAGHWAESDIMESFHRGNVKGYPDGAFRPEEPITRAEAAAILIEHTNSLVDLIKHPAKRVLSKYKDKEIIPAWANKFVVGVTIREFMRGYPDNTFRPNNAITRLEAIHIIYESEPINWIYHGEMKELLNSTEKLSKDHLDLKDIPNWAEISVLWTIRKKGLRGYKVDNGFLIKPNEKIERAEFISLLTRPINYYR